MHESSSQGPKPSPDAQQNADLGSERKSGAEMPGLTETLGAMANEMQAHAAKESRRRWLASGLALACRLFAFGVTAGLAVAHLRVLREINRSLKR